jgi:hypothetical protein
MNSNEVTILTEAILDLYLAIKIRSSEEVSKNSTDLIQLEKISDEVLTEEKDRLKSATAF